MTIVNFSNSERVDMVIFYGVVQHLRDHGTFNPQTHDRGRDQRILQAEEQISERIEEEPDISTRRLAAEV